MAAYFQRFTLFPYPFSHGPSFFFWFCCPNCIQFCSHTQHFLTSVWTWIKDSGWSALTIHEIWTASSFRPCTDRLARDCPFVDWAELFPVSPALFKFLPHACASQCVSISSVWILLFSGPLGTSLLPSAPSHTEARTMQGLDLVAVCPHPFKGHFISSWWWFARWRVSVLVIPFMLLWKISEIQKPYCPLFYV